MTFRGPFQPKPFYYSVWEHHSEHPPEQGEQSALQHQLFFSSAPSHLSETDNCLPTSPSLGAAFPSFPRPLPQLPPGIHCCNFLSHGNPHGIGYCNLCASTSLPGICGGNWWHLQFDACIAPGTWGTPQQGPSNTQQRAQEVTKSNLVPQATGRGQHVSAGTVKVNVAITCSNRLSNPEDTGAPRQPSLSTVVASKSPGDIRGELEMLQVWWGWWALFTGTVPWSRSALLLNTANQRQPLIL